MRVAQVVYDDLTWDTVTTSFETLFDSAYSVSVFSRYGERPEQVWLKFRADDARLHDSLGTALAGAARATVELHPIRSMSAEATTAQLGQPGRWDERLPHFRAAFQPSAGEEIQTEFFVDLRDGAAALEALRGIAPALDDVLLVSEIRTVAADALWMSPTYGRHSAAFHFTWRRDPPPSIGQSASSRCAWPLCASASLGKGLPSIGVRCRRVGL
ncbi:MAG: hypothetical protein R2710_21985 [Acidimicrobiales bacterium]